jgi:hypothetical protein
MRSPTTRSATADGFQQLVRRLARLGDPIRLPVGDRAARQTDGWSIGRW